MVHHWHCALSPAAQPPTRPAEPIEARHQPLPKGTNSGGGTTPVGNRAGTPAGTPAETLGGTLREPPSSAGTPFQRTLPADPSSIGTPFGALHAPFEQTLPTLEPLPAPLLGTFQHRPPRRKFCLRRQPRRTPCIPVGKGTSTPSGAQGWPPQALIGPRQTCQPTVGGCLPHPVAGLGQRGSTLSSNTAIPPTWPSCTTIRLPGCVALTRNLLGFGAGNSSSKWTNGPRLQSSGVQSWVDASISKPAENLCCQWPWAMGGVQHRLVQGHCHHSRKPAQILLHNLLCPLIDFLCPLGIHLCRRVVQSRRILPRIPLTVFAQLTHMYSTKRTVVTRETLRRRVGLHQAVARAATVHGFRQRRRRPLRTGFSPGWRNDRQCRLVVDTVCRNAPATPPTAGSRSSWG